MSDLGDVRGALGNAFRRIMTFLRIPSSGGPPYWIVGGKIPAELAAFYAPDTMTSVMLAYASTTQYHYSGWITDGVAVAYVQGWVDTGTVYEMFVQYLDLAAHPGPRFVAVRGTLQIPNGSPPYMLFGPDVPASLAAFYAGSGTIIAAQITYAANGVDYHYTIWVYANASGDWTYAQGFVSQATVFETFTQFQDVTNLTRNLEFGDVLNDNIFGTNYFFSGATGSPNAHLMVPGASDYSKVEIDSLTDFRIDGRSQGRGIVAAALAGGATAAFVAETVVLTINNITFRSKRLYRSEIFAGIFGTSPVGQYNIRKNNLAGAIVWSSPALPNSNAFGFPGNYECLLMNNTAADIAGTYVLTLTPLGGGNISHQPMSTLRTWMVEEIGSTDSALGEQV